MVTALMMMTGGAFSQSIDSINLDVIPYHYTGGGAIQVTNLMKQHDGSLVSMIIVSDHIASQLVRKSQIRCLCQAVMSISSFYWTRIRVARTTYASIPNLTAKAVPICVLPTFQTMTSSETPLRTWSSHCVTKKSLMILTIT